MATTPPRFCSGSPTCTHRTTDGPCPVHARQQEHARSTFASRHWYRIGRWRHPVWGLRSVVLREQPFCPVCLTEENAYVPTTEVDHVIPHDGDPVLFWDRANLQGLCRFHHGQKTGRGL